jgi:hypothetical protein
MLPTFDGLMDSNMMLTDKLGLARAFLDEQREMNRMRRQLDMQRYHLEIKINDLRGEFQKDLTIFELARFLSAY